jgi:hypothetical protein
VTIYGAIEKVANCPTCNAEFVRGPESLYERTAEAEVECVHGHRWKVLDVYKDRSIHWFKLSGPGRELLG